MNPEFSSYYPPRAQDRWLPRAFGPRIDRLRVWLRVQFSRSPLATPIVLTLTGPALLRCLLLPGEPYRALGQSTLGRIFFIAWWVWALVMLVFLPSQTVVGLAVSGMTSCHASGLGFLYLRDREAEQGYPVGLLGKTVAPLVAWLLCAFLIYWPGYKLFEYAVARPLYLPAENRSVVFNSLARAQDIREGDLVAYKMDGFRQYAGGEVPVNVRGGLMLGRVIGLPGDRIEFGPDRIHVNGHSAERSTTMPTAGGVKVAPGTWVIWPAVNMRLYNFNLGAQNLQDAFLRLANVPQQNFIGRAFHRWFFQRQDQP